VHDSRYVDLLIMFDGAKLQNKFDMAGVVDKLTGRQGVEGRQIVIHRLNV
jgi:hypothetical protein